MERLSLQQYLMEVIWPAFLTTINVMTWTVLISTVIGFVLAVVMNVTKEDGLHPNRYVSQALDFLINLIRSFPFVILMVSLIPVTRFVTGSSIGVKAAHLPLVHHHGPLYGPSDPEPHGAGQQGDYRGGQVLRRFHLPNYLACDYRGVHPRHLLCHLLCHSGRPQRLHHCRHGRCGGLGNVAIRYGYNNFNDTIMYSTVAILVVLVQLIQFVGNTVYKKLK